MMQKFSSKTFNLIKAHKSVAFRCFSQTTTSASDSEGANKDLRPKIEPLKKQVTDFLKNTNQFEEQIQDVLTPYYFETDKLKGYCSEAGTDKYYRRSQYDDAELEVHPDNFKNPFNSNIKLSTLGIGTYVGQPDDYTDYLMYDAIKTSVLSGGVNHIDTAPNYRYMKSEKTVGRVLSTLDNKYGIKRSELFISTKAGYIPEDADRLINRREMTEKLVKDLKVPESEIVRESGHCLHPIFLEQQLKESLDRLNLKCIDLYYLQNPYEGQGPYNTDNVFYDRLTAAFEFLESMVQRGKIRNYGITTYSSLRVKPTEDKIHLNLEKVVRLAEKVGGAEHHMRFVQVPINVLMPEAFVEPWQRYEEKGTGVIKQKMLLSVCSDLNMNVISSQPLMQGNLANMPLSRSNISVFNIPARHLQMMRSIPSKAIKSTLVGMKQPDHVRGNLEIIKKPLMTREDFFETLKPHRRQEYIEEELDM